MCRGSPLLLLGGLACMTGLRGARRLGNQGRFGRRKQAKALGMTGPSKDALDDAELVTRRLPSLGDSRTNDSRRKVEKSVVDKRVSGCAEPDQRVDSNTCSTTQWWTSTDPAGSGWTATCCTTARPWRRWPRVRISPR